MQDQDIARIETPLGTLTAAATAHGITRLWFDDPTPETAADAAARRWLARLREQLDAYFERGARVFDVPLDLHGTPFQLAVWRALLPIPPGTTTTYGDVARAAGAPPQAVRAVGAAIGRNPVAIVVPCHRVIGRDGGLTGYAAGLPRKQALLQLEGALLL
jgi:methylated-DNA-[protein]-cysteine S-methyltransferase